MLKFYFLSFIFVILFTSFVNALFFFRVLFQSYFSISLFLFLYFIYFLVIASNFGFLVILFTSSVLLSPSPTHAQFRFRSLWTK